MPVYIVTYEHPDEQGWQQHLMAHVGWLRERVADGSLLASGPFSNKPGKSALLVMTAPDHSSIEAIIATDPFAVENLIANMTIDAWDPIFGTFNVHSSMPRES